MSNSKISRFKRKKLLFSEARFAVLRVIFYTSAGVSLREVSYRSDLSIGAVQTAVKALQRIKLVRKKCVGRRTVYRLKKSHPEYSLLQVLFEFIENEQIRSQALDDSKANVNLLKLLGEMINLSSKLRKAAHAV